MLGLLTNWLAKGQDDRSAVAAAVTHFEASTGNKANRSMCSVISETPERSVVRICYGTTRPPRRAWFSVPQNREALIREVPWDEAQELGECAWR